MYRFLDPPKKRHLALDTYIEERTIGRSTSRVAQKKKARLNQLRIFNRYKNPGYCRRLTNDMRYLDKKYLKNAGRTNNICIKTKKRS